MVQRRFSPTRGRRIRLDEALLEQLVMSPVGRAYTLRLAPRIDGVLIPRSHGRWSSLGPDRVGLLTTTGARTGVQRTNPVGLMDLDGGLMAIGSNYGRAKHPSWSTNLVANPDCELEFRGCRRPQHARLLQGDERAQAWETALDFFAGYARYAETAAPRQIRLFLLTPR